MKMIKAKQKFFINNSASVFTKEDFSTVAEIINIEGRKILSAYYYNGRENPKGGGQNETAIKLQGN